MGSITSRPKAPASPQIVYVPSPAPTPSVSQDSADQGSSNTPSTPVQTEEEIVREVRTQNLLRRDRGRFGTILSGFRGFLNSGSNSGGKQLLGE